MVKAKNAFYAQSGGVTAVINASACGVIETVNKTKKINKVLAGKNGILGALNEELIDTSKESKNNIAKLRQTPGGAFGSCRFKLQDPIKQKKEYERLFDHKLKIYCGSKKEAITDLIYSSEKINSFGLYYRKCQIHESIRNTLIFCRDNYSK